MPDDPDTVPPAQKDTPPQKPEQIEIRPGQIVNEMHPAQLVATTLTAVVNDESTVVPGLQAEHKRKTDLIKIWFAIGSLIGGIALCLIGNHTGTPADTELGYKVLAFAVGLLGGLKI